MLTYVLFQIFESAVRGLIPIRTPLLVNFPIPDTGNRFSLKPGSLSEHFPQSKTSEVEKSASLNAAIAGARAAATQFNKKDQSFQGAKSNDTSSSVRTRLSSKLHENEVMPTNTTDKSNKRDLATNSEEKVSRIKHGGSSGNHQPHWRLEI